MNHELTKIRAATVAAALAAIVSGTALADDNSMSIWTGDSYASFNGGRDFPRGNPVIDKAPSAFRQTNPQGLTNAQYAALSEEDPAWQIPNPQAAALLASTDEATSWRQSHPQGFSAREYESLSANSPIWKLPEPSPASTAYAAANAPVVYGSAPAAESLWTRMARFFRNNATAEN